MTVKVTKIENCYSNMTIKLTSETTHSIDTVLFVLADCENGSRVDLTSSVSDQIIILPDTISKATIYVLRMYGPMNMVKRAEPIIS